MFVVVLSSFQEALGTTETRKRCSSRDILANIINKNPELLVNELMGFWMNNLSPRLIWQNEVEISDMFFHKFYG